MNDDHTPPACACGALTHRVYNAHHIVDEIRGTSYFHPTKRTTVRDHGRVFDVGMGAWYSTKSERKRKMQARGLKEYGPNREI